MSIYDMSSSLYRDVGCPSQCSSMNEYASVDEMNGINGAVPIPEATAKRFYQTPSTVNSQGQVVNPIAEAQAANAQLAVAQQRAQAANAAAAQYIRYNRRN